jgi:uncharacterized membrane protein
MIKKAGLAALTMMFLDGLWLGLIANQFYLSQLKHLIRGDGTKFDVNYPAAGLVYALMVVGFLVFISPSLHKWSYREAIFKSAVFGIVVYGVYDFTNLATLRDWPWIVAVVDVLWGAVLYSVTTLVVKKASQSGWV